jgi:hypothetical protein
MLVTHTESKKKGIWLNTRGNELLVWNVNDGVKDVWPIELTECDLGTEEKEDKNDEFRNLLHAITSPKGMEVVNESELMLLVTKSIAYFLENGYLGKKDTLEDSIKILQEVLYHSLGECFPFGVERDEILMFIHQKLPYLIQGAYWGFALSPIANPPEVEEEVEEEEDLCAPHEFEESPIILLEKKPLTYYGCCGNCFRTSRSKL